MRSKGVRSAVVGTALSLLVAGCGGSGEETSTVDTADAPRGASAVFAELAKLPYEQRLETMKQKATEEGKITLYSSRDADLLEKFKKRFEELYPGVEVEALSGNTSELFSRIQQEGTGRNAAVDVVLADMLPAMTKEGLAAKLHDAVAPQNYPKNGYGENYMKLGPSPTIMAWNTNLVPPDQVPDTWDDLLDPKWKGKVAIDVEPEDMVTGMVIKWGEEKTREYLTKFMANKPIIRKGHSTINELLAAGEFPIAAEVFAHNTSKAIKKGAPLDFKALDPTAGGANTYMVAEAAPHPYAAGLFAHFLADVPGGEIIADDGRLVLTPGVKQKFPDVAALIGDPRLPDADPLEQAAAAEVATRLIEEFVTPAFTK